jgi:hypothetical protein
VDASDETSEGRVYGGGVEDGCEEDEDALDDVGGDLICVVVGEYADAVAGYLDCERRELARKRTLIELKCSPNGVGRTQSTDGKDTAVPGSGYDHAPAVSKSNSGEQGHKDCCERE